MNRTHRLLTTLAGLAVAATLTGCSALGVGSTATSAAGTAAASGTTVAMAGTPGITASEVLAANATPQRL